MTSRRLLSLANGLGCGNWVLGVGCGELLRRCMTLQRVCFTGGRKVTQTINNFDKALDRI